MLHNNVQQKPFRNAAQLESAQLYIKPKYQHLLSKTSRSRSVVKLYVVELKLHYHVSYNFFTHTYAK